MDCRTDKEKKLDLIFVLVIIVTMLIPLCLIGHKWFGWWSEPEADSSDTVCLVDDVDKPDDTVNKEKTVSVGNSIYRDSVQLEYVNGHHYIEINVNGIKMKGMLDSGCSLGIAGCVVDYYFLKRHGYFEELGIGEAMMGNGEIVTNIIGEVYDVKIGGVILDTVICGFNGSQNSELIIGKNILKQLNSYVIDYNKNKLYIK